MKRSQFLVVISLALLLAGCGRGQQMAEGLGGFLSEGAAIVATAEAENPLPGPLPTEEGTSASPGARPAVEPTASPGNGTAEAADGPLYLNPDAATAARVDDLLARMTLAEKIAQMTQVEKNSISPGKVAELGIGSVLSGGGGYPPRNTPAAWAEMVGGYLTAARESRLGIPLLYGFDAIHGAAAVDGATLFPQPIGMAATGDPELVRQTARVTALESTALGVRWNFAPVLAVVQDVRWGRTYESLGDDTALVAELGVAYLRGLQEADADGGLPATDDSHGASGGGPSPAGRSPLAHPTAMLATPKHYIGDGATVWGSSTQNIMDVPYMLDQGDMQLEEAAVRELLLPPYAAAVDAGALSIMASFNSWNGDKVHGSGRLINDILKGELGFRGFVVSDWGGCDQIDPDYYTAIVRCVNAGVDMNMVPYDYMRFMDTLDEAVANGDVSAARIDDAVRRILTVKFEMGLFDAPPYDGRDAALVGAADHRALAREAVRRSLVLLRNENAALPIDRNATARIVVAGVAADDAGTQAGGWTIEWQGAPGRAIAGATTLLEGIEAAAGGAEVVYAPDGAFDGAADVGIVVLAEPPYAEGVGDRADLRLTDEEAALVARVAAATERTVVVLLSGRPLVIDDALPLADAWVAAWLPGSEGAGVADVLFGDAPFRGKLPLDWPAAAGGVLFPRGFGLTNQN